ncbi:MAG TPA: polyhydroxyalkanoate synthesis regulator DNA-binding domain-containing protein [Deltaproteobacteria bacterium]|nr:polyhydroxyalkanoate synthesis regulator DNA-binding domain-containing protein [Deltaproteobacteria bacterium]HOI06446.1 polyhydroxyalkanoate synthesis regulator DNA-binding domain-containing protein [Deltaproteobacteria bacterium]
MAKSEKLLLKKYGNRRLYDTAKSSYVTLADVAEIIRKGTDVEVIDADTKQDVTAFILTQIVLEQARKKNALLPPELLHLIIRYGENVLQEFFEKYLQHIIQNYLEFKKTADQQFSKWIDMQKDYSDMARKTLEGLTSFQPFFGSFPEPPDREKK